MKGCFFMTELTALSDQQKKALQLHSEIRAGISMAGQGMIQICKGLKEMRDMRGFELLGYEDLSDYTVKEFGFKQRQAYNYIRIYENLGEPLLADNADLGITKLLALVNVPALEREQFLEDHDNSKDLSTAEFEKLVQENSKKGEQLALFEQQVHEKDETIIDKTKELQKTKEENRRLKADLEKERQKNKNSPVPASTAPDQKTIDSIRLEEKQKAETAYNKKLQQLEQSKQAEIKELKTKLEQKNASDKKVVTNGEEGVRIYFDSLKSAYNSLISAVDRLEPETAYKYKNAVKKFLEMMCDAISN